MQPKLEGDGSELEILYLNDGELRPGPDEWIETIPYATPMDGMTFSSDGQLLAVSTNRRFYIWEVAAHRLLLMQPRFTAINADLTFSPDSRLVATTSEYNRQIWQISDCDVASAVGPGETKFLPDGRELVSIWNYYGIHEIEFFEPAGGGQLRPMKEKSIIGAPSDYLRALAVAPVGDYMAVATGKSVMLRQVSDGSLISVIDVRESVADTAFSPDGQLLAVGNGAFISLYKIPDGTLRQEIRAGDSDVEQIEFSPDGKMLASQAGTVRLWNVLDGSMLYELETRGPFAFSSDGSILATKLWKNETPDSSNKDAVQVGLWRTSDGHRLGTLNDNSKISSLAFSPDGTIPAVSSEGGTILFWGVTP
jgi:WD40 repeat protein